MRMAKLVGPVLAAWVGWGCGDGGAPADVDDMTPDLDAEVDGSGGEEAEAEVDAGPTDAFPDETDADEVADSDGGESEGGGPDATADGPADEPLDEVAVDGPAGETAGSARIGDPCTSATACPEGGSGAAVCLTSWPGGYCAVEACAEHGHDCPEDPGLGGTATTGGKCVLDPAAYCLALCGSDGDCRPGYRCAPRPDAAGHGTADVCVPAG